MIEVPAKVKDALRSGDFKKEYKIITYRDYEFYDTMAVDIYPSSQGGHGSGVTPILTAGNKYKISRNQTNGFANIVLTGDGNSYIITPDVISTTGYTYVEFIPPVTGVCILEGEHFGEYPEPITKSLNIDIADQILIDNDHLVSETIKFDERMCSDTELKFGLCEGTSVEFQYFDLPSILGCHLNISIDVQYMGEENEISWYEIPMGQYDVKEISRQASTGIIKVIAYNKLMSDYLEQNMNSNIIALLNSAPGNVLPMSDILYDLMADYSIQKASSTELVRSFSSAWSKHALGITESVNGSRAYNGYRLTVIGYDISIYAEFLGQLPFDPDALYKFIVDLSKIVVREAETELLQRSDLYNVWDDNTQQELPLLDFMSGNYQYSDYFGGAVIIQTDTDTYKYRLYQGDFERYEVGYMDNVRSFRFIIPAKITSMRMADYYYTHDRIWHDIDPYINMYEAAHLWDHPEVFSEAENIVRNVFSRFTSSPVWTIYQKVSPTPADSINIHLSDIEAITDEITLRELQSAVFELNCQYGKLDRVTDLFEGIELNNGGLYPRDNLYPADNLYPQGNAEAGYPSMYSKLWADEGNVRSFRYLIITYKTTETIEGQTQEVEKTLQRTVNADGTDDYNMSDNWLFKNLVWTAADIGDYADAMVTKMQNIRWFPFEMWCAGLPYLEAGDEIEIQMNEGTYKSYILRRTLKGIQNLQDELINGTLDIF